MPFVHKKDFINKSERAFWLVSSLVQVVFILTDQHKDKQEILLYNVAESHNKKMCVCVCIFFQLHWKGVEDETNSVLSPEIFWIISKALEFFCKGFVTSALMNSLLMSLALFVSWKEAVPQKKLKRIKNAKRKISRD